MAFNADLLYQKYQGQTLSYAIDSWYNGFMQFVINSKTHGKQTVYIDNEDSDLVLGLGKWSLTNNRAGFYALKNIKGKKVYLHRLIAKTPDGLVTDHINGNTLDNRKNNLRACSHRANIRNSPKAKGISWLPKRNKWLAQITVKRKNIFLGHFKTEKEALAARRLAVEKYWNI